MATITGIHHIALTVQDADRSVGWYQDLLGMQVLLHADEDDVRLRVLIHPDSGVILGLRQYPARPDGAFDEHRTGLDHFALAVSSRAELEAWEGVLRDRGVPFTPIVETPIGTVVVLRDPDNVQVELWLPLG